MKQFEEKAYYEEMLNALIQGDRSTCFSITDRFLDSGNSIEVFYENICKPALYKIGQLWEYNQISVATEHVASAIMESILNQVYYRIISMPKHSKLVIAASLEGEYHQIGVKMICDIFEMNGWNSLLIGANTPEQELIAFIREKKPDMLALSLTIYFHLPTLERLLKFIYDEFPQLRVLVGGQAFLHGAEDLLYKFNNVRYLSDIFATKLYINSINKNE